MYGAAAIFRPGEGGGGQGQSLNPVNEADHHFPLALCICRIVCPAGPSTVVAASMSRVRGRRQVCQRRWQWRVRP